MSIVKVSIDGVEYGFAPQEPELCQHPTPSYPVTITPEIARNWLTYNYVNRNQREKGKRDYVSDMRRGDFLLNGATITFTRPYGEGEDENVPAGKPALLDGQHRLESCVRSGKPFVSYVAYGLNPRVRPTIDTGIKRTLADELQMRGYKNTIVLSSVISRVHAWQNGDYHLTMKKVTDTNPELLDFLGENKEIERSAEIASRTRADFAHTTGHALRQSVAGLAHWLFMRTDESLAPEFFARLGDGAEMTADDPIMFMRRRLVKDLVEKKQLRGSTRRELVHVPDWQQLCYYIRTWNARLAWLATPDGQRSLLPAYALVGHKDAEQMPTIKTADQVLKELRDREARLAAKEAKAA
jgi:hypothetical protein